MGRSIVDRIFGHTVYNVRRLLERSLSDCAPRGEQIGVASPALRPDHHVLRNLH
jgi:hypothetical protein